MCVLSLFFYLCVLAIFGQLCTLVSFVFYFGLK